MAHIAIGARTYAFKQMGGSMVFFILAALLSGVFFFVIVSIQPSKDPLIKFKFLEDWEKERPIIVLLSFAVLVIFILWMASGHIHPLGSKTAQVSDVIASPQFVRAGLGIFFGAFFVLWLHRLLAETDPQKIPFSLTIQGVLLLCLLLAGTQDAFNPIFQRLNSVKLGGAELSFFQRSSLNRPPDRSLNTVSNQAGKPSNGRSGLDLLANLTRMMKTDYKDYIPNIVKKENEKLANAKQHYPPNTTEFIDNTIVRLAQCYQEIIKRTQYTQLMDDTVQKLMLPFAEFAAISKAARDAMPKEDRSNNLAPEALERLKEPVRNVTAVLAQAIVDAVTFIKTTHMQVVGEEQGANKPGCKSLHDKYDHFLLDHKRRELANNLNRELYNKLSQDTEFVNRPYYALAYAALASLNNKGPAGFAVLDEWAHDGENYENELEKNSKSKPESEEETWNRSKQMWFNARVRLNLYSLMETWLRSNASIPPIFHEYHFKNLKKTIESYSQIKVVKDSLDNFGELSQPLSESGYSSVPKDSEYSSVPKDSKCKIRNDDAISYNFGYTLLTLEVNYVEKAVNQKQYFEFYSRDANSYSNYFDKLNLGCVQDREDRKTIRAELLQVTARARLANLEITRKIESNEQITTELKLIGNVVNLGNEIIGEPSTAHLPESWIDTVASLREEEVAGELTALRDQIKNQLELLGQ